MAFHRASTVPNQPGMIDNITRRRFSSLSICAKRRIVLDLLSSVRCSKQRKHPQTASGSAEHPSRHQLCGNITTLALAIAQERPKMSYGLTRIPEIRIPTWCWGAWAVNRVLSDRVSRRAIVLLLLVQLMRKTVPLI